MATTDWIWTLSCALSAMGFAAWIWRAAVDMRDLDAVPDHQLLRAIASHLPSAQRPWP